MYVVGIQRSATSAQRSLKCWRRKPKGGVREIGGSPDVVRVCNQLVASRGAPVRIFVDNGSEFSGKLFDLWAYHNKVQIDFSRPGKPTDNCFIETFNGSLRDECLNVDWFETIDEARIKIESWRINYNESRPHQGLNDLAPVEYARKMALRTMEQSVINAGN